MLVGLVASTALAAACGGDDDAQESADTTSAVTTEAPAEAAGFPLTVTHKYGETVVERVPQRVVTVETGKEEYALAVGVVPVGAVRSTFADFAEGLSPWAIEAIDDQPMPELMTFADGIDLEAVAVLEPDLILGPEGLTPQDYEALAKIAPTVAQAADFEDYTSPWNVQAQLVGQALGLADEMDAVIADVQQGFVDAAASHPEFHGATAVFAGDFGDGQVWVFPDYRNDFFAQLGFELPPTLTDDVLADPISGELLELIEADALIMALYAGEGTASIESNPTFSALPSFTTGNVLLVPGTTPALSSINFSTPLSLPVALDQFVPALAALVDGDPATTPPRLS
jgi:iron-siderophore transport system substrate-binding protein